jgi:hypothetical protein
VPVSQARAELEEHFRGAVRDTASGRTNQAHMVCEDTRGLVEIAISRTGTGTLSLSLRLAYANPRSSYALLSELLAWFGRQYDAVAAVSSPPGDVAVDLQLAGLVFDDPLALEAAIAPSIDYNRRLWQLDAGSTEECIISGEAAIARFILPKCKPLASEQQT